MLSGTVFISSQTEMQSTVWRLQTSRLCDAKETVGAVTSLGKKKKTLEGTRLATSNKKKCNN